MAWSALMQDARYLRAQAALCLQIADQMSDPRSAEKMRADAADYHARAAAIEQGEPPPLSAESPQR
jgi:hypothetical protein